MAAEARVPQNDDEQLATLLTAAVPRPSFLSSNPGACLALACHVLMIDAGFVTYDTNASAAPSSKYAPPKQWNGTYMDQWVFSYTRAGKANRFTLHCSLQSKTLRMFVHASEDANPKNVQILGLQQDIYFPDTAPLAKEPAWAHVLHEPAKLRNYIHTFIATPLLAQAEDGEAPALDLPTPSPDTDAAATATGGRSWLASVRSWESTASITASQLAVAATIGCVAALLLYRLTLRR